MGSATMSQGKTRVGGGAGPPGSKSAQPKKAAKSTSIAPADVPRAPQAVDNRITAAEAARLLCRSPKAVMLAGKKGFLKVDRLGTGRMYFSRTQVEALAKNVEAM